MILAAGLGTRLRPLTEIKPKSLVPVANKPMLGRIIDYLKKYGVSEIIINAHHHHGQIKDFVSNHSLPGVDIEVRVEPQILGTGGGIKNTADFWSHEPFFVINSDILTDIDLNRALREHNESGSLATLILHDQPPFNQISLNGHNMITDIKREKDIRDSGLLAFTGIHILEPGLLDHITDKGFSDIIDIYLRLIEKGETIKGWLSKDHYWRDIGSIESYLTANRDYSKTPFEIGKGCTVSEQAKLKDWVVMGDNCAIEDNAEISSSVLWEGVKVKRGVKVIDSIVTSSKVIDHDLIGKYI